ncbi:glycoside hydrolase family 128 protein [Wolfiporia cocos MD-104 SS10]|uniref:Glycoside hydrolase family 128 protein n=1 Tax=Wolfiporia cocos (strain MD-104) TaxID=742152 RepID=A0A2H3JW04_WOLCO|nr:glycoside hydrolase family 128 protein [Wolfiporia cocos MD-104 SS10]
MKFTAALVSLSLLLAGSADAAHISNLKLLKNQHVRYGLNHRRGASATWAPTSTYTETQTATATASSSSSAPSSTSSSSSSAFSSGIKRGLSFNDASLTDQFTSSEVSWAYNWASSYSGSLPSGVQYIPMLWGSSSSFTSVWNANAEAAIQNGAEYLFGPNEPDLDTQANLSPAEAASLWQEYMEPFAGKAKLIAPAVTNGAAPMGEAWLTDFVSACTGCTIDGYAMHIYDSATNIAYYKEYISNFTQTFQKPVWVTEFGATGSDSDVQTFLGEMVTFLNDLDGVAAYAWFMVESGNLVNSDGSFTTLADTYIN